MWLYFALASAFFLGLYDITKKISLRKNSVMWVLFSISLFSTVFLSPFFHTGPAANLALLVPKAFLVTASWISGLIGMKMLPLTTVSTIKASRPIFVVLFSIIIFGENFTWTQWVGIILGITALMMLSRSSRHEGIYFTRNKGIMWMAVSVVTGVASALYDKFAIGLMDPLFVQCWSNLFITILMGIVLFVKSLKGSRKRERFHWDWYLPLTAAIIVAADALYFFALDCDGSLLAVISLLRRCSVIVTFILGAVIFKEDNIRRKAVDLLVLLAGMSFLLVRA